ncbi:hypothetical protein BJX99DRAFT_248613 [Aspergillus californicus]
MQNCRELFVNPLLWTSHHFNLLGCRSVENVDNTSIESTQGSDKTEDNQRPCAEPPSDAELLARNPVDIVKHRCLVDILVGEGRPFAAHRKGSDFFAGKPVHRPHYTAFYRHGQPNEHVDRGAPPLACPDPRGRPNWIGEWTQDPYFVCLLLALAQLQERKLEPPKPINYTSRFLVTNMKDREYFQKLPFKPYDTFNSRLTADLVAPSCFNNPRTKRRHEQENSSPCKVRRLL